MFKDTRNGKVVVRFRLLLIVDCLACAICMSVSAQTYSIRTEFRTNLRASYSLTAQVVETAPSGAILQVVGNFERWLKINRNGIEVWMADWVRHTRTDGSQQQLSSAIDNCCNVNRHCTAEHEWVSGYWAYQNNECPVSTQSQEQTSTQQETNTPAQTDNCCFVDRQCQSDQEWTDGYWAYQNNQCGAAAQSQSQVSVSGGGQLAGSGR